VRCTPWWRVCCVGETDQPPSSYGQIRELGAEGQERDVARRRTRLPRRTTSWPDVVSVMPIGVAVIAHAVRLGARRRYRRRRRSVIADRDDRKRRHNRIAALIVMGSCVKSFGYNRAGRRGDERAIAAPDRAGLRGLLGRSRESLLGRRHQRIAQTLGAGGRSFDCQPTCWRVCAHDAELAASHAAAAASAAAVRPPGRRSWSAECSISVEHRRRQSLVDRFDAGAASRSQDGHRRPAQNQWHAPLPASLNGVCPGTGRNFQS
jgi:hypothetical protein